MKLEYGGKTVVVDDIKDLQGLRDALEDHEYDSSDAELVILHFGCTSADISQGLLKNAFNHVLSSNPIEEDLIACISPVEFNVFNYRTLNIDRYTIVMRLERLEFFLQVKWDTLHQLLLTLSFYQHRKHIPITGNVTKKNTLEKDMVALEIEIFNKNLDEICIIVPTKNIAKCKDIHLPDDLAICYSVHADDKTTIIGANLERHQMVMPYRYPFNYAKIHNYLIGKEFAGMYKYYILCNDDIVLDRETINKLLEPLAIDDGVGIVGARLFYPDGSVQHDGVRLDKKLGAVHIDRGKIVQGVEEFKTECETTFALVAIRKKCFNDIGGFDENFAFDFNDIDFCIRAKQKGWQVVINPEAKAGHFESRTRKADGKTSNKNELKMFKEKHKDVLK